MREFFTAQTDYIFFVYGLAFLLLAITSHFIYRLRPFQTFWKWIALFGLLHGVTEWLDMCALSLEDNIPLIPLKVTFLVLSFLCFIEIAREEAQKRWGKIFGKWIYAPLLFIILGFGWMMDGLTGIDILSRYILGFIGGLLAARAIMTSMAQSSPKSHSLTPFAWLLGCYATTQFIAPTGGAFLPASLINTNTFIAVMGFPLQLPRMALAGILAAMAWREYTEERLALLTGTNVKNKAQKKPWLTIGLIAVLLVGWILVEYIHQNTETKERQALLNRVTVAAAMVDPARIKALSGTPDDLENNNYKFIQQQFHNILKTQPGVLSVYLFGLENGKNVFLIDVAPPGKKTSSEPFAIPGEKYREDAKLLGQIFRSGGAVTVGPETGKWGTFISSLAAIHDPTNGKIIAVIGMDYDANEWALMIQRHRLSPILTTLLFTVLFIGSFFSYRREREVSQDAQAGELKLKKLMAQLEEEQKNLEAIFDSTQVGLLLVDSNCEVKRLNQVVLNMCGQKFFSSADNESKNTLGKTADRVLKTGQNIRGEEIPLIISSPGGEKKLAWLEINASPIEFKNERHILFSLVNITERKNTETEKEQQLHELDVFFKASVNREERIISLKNELETLKLQLKDKEITGL